MTENLLWTEGVLSGILMAGQLGSVKKNYLVESRAEINLFPWLLGYWAKGLFLAELSRDTWEQRTSLEGLREFGRNLSAVTCIYLGGGRTCLCHILGVLMPWTASALGDWWGTDTSLARHRAPPAAGDGGEEETNLWETIKGVISRSDLREKCLVHTQGGVISSGERIWRLLGTADYFERNYVLG